MSGPGTNLERAEQTLVNAHHGTRIVELSTVVRCAKQGDELTFGEELVSILDHLVGTTDEVHVMFLQEARNHVRTEGEADASIIFAPASDIFVGVRPKKIAKKTAVRDLQQVVSTHVNTSQGVEVAKRPQQESQCALEREGRAYVSWSHDTADLLHGVQIGTQTAVHGEDLLVNDGCDGQAVEAVRKCLPQLDVVPALALIVETVDAVDRGALVVATQNEEVLGVLDLVGQ